MEYSNPTYEYIILVTLMEPKNLEVTFHELTLPFHEILLCFCTSIGMMILTATCIAFKLVYLLGSIFFVCKRILCPNENIYLFKS